MEAQKTSWMERLKFFSLGAICLALLLVLLGAAADHQNSTLNFGRYQISSWATQIDSDSGIVGAFVMDTVSGETRTVYMRTYGTPPSSRAEKNDLKRPFNAIQ